MFLTAKRLSDQKTLYFYDLDSYNDYKDTYDEDLSEFSIVLDVPFGEEVIDISEERNELRQALHMVGLPLEKNIIQDLYSTQTNVTDPGEKVNQMRKMSKKVFDIQDNNKIEETTDNPREIIIRQNKLNNVNLFKAFYMALTDNRKKLVKDIFQQHKLDIEKLDTYIDEEINMNIDVYLHDYDTESEYKQAIKKYKKTNDYLKHKNFMKAIDKSYDAVRFADDKEDAEKIKKE